MSRCVIVSYAPKPGKDADLLIAVEKHLRVLKAENLITDRPGYVMRSRDGYIIEVFEWRSAEAIEQAHSNAAVGKLWAEFEKACRYVPLSDIDECRNLFAEFEPVEF